MVPGNIGDGLNAALEFAQIQNTIGDNPVILVFDDLERSRIPYIELLGCINDYCENKHFNTIIVSNEDKIQKEIDADDDNLSYNDIKEKIVQRVVRYIPDYKAVVQSIIDSITDVSAEYKDFLNDNKDLITSVLAGDVDDNVVMASIGQSGHLRTVADVESEYIKTQSLLQSRPHNIRSIKCAIQDFERVYMSLKKFDAENIDKWFGTFATFVMAYRANLVQGGEGCDGILTDADLKKMYFGIYNSNYKSESVFEWVQFGIWNEDEISAEIKAVIKREKAIDSKDIVRTYRLVDMDDENLEAGFPAVLEMAYEGQLSIDEYVNFIQNCAYSRVYDIPLRAIDWEKIKTGISKMLDESLDDINEPPRHSFIISADQRKYYSTDEWSAYELIKNFRTQSRQMFSNNEKIYINLLTNDVGRAFEETVNKRYDCFTQDMMGATIAAFESANNIVKLEFSNYFKKVWGIYFNNTNLTLRDLKTTINMFEELKRRLEVLYGQYKDSGKHISATHTKKFMEVVTDLIKDANLQNGEAERETE